MKNLLSIMKLLSIAYVFLFSICGFAQSKADIEAGKRLVKVMDEVYAKKYEDGQLKAIHGKWQLKSVSINQRTFYREKIAEHVKDEYKLATEKLEQPMSVEDSKKYLEKLKEVFIEIFKLSYEFGPYRFSTQNGVDGKVRFNTNKDVMTLTWNENGEEQNMPWSITQLDKSTLVLTTMTRYIEPKVYTFDKK